MISHSAALFLDRDGVINRFDRRAPVDAPLDILPGVIQALQLLSSQFSRLFIVTNQGGIGHGYMTLSDLYRQHALLLQQFHTAQIHIDRIYTAPDHVRYASQRRKPDPGMAQEAIADFPDIDMSESWMVGDRYTDVQFAERAGIGYSVFIGADRMSDFNKPCKPTIYCEDLLDFAQWLTRSQ